MEEATDRTAPPAKPAGRPIGALAETAYFVRVLRGQLTNADMLAWFSEGERGVCETCGDKASVAMPNAVASFCLTCGAVTVDGVRIDVERRLPV